MTTTHLVRWAKTQQVRAGGGGVARDPVHSAVAAGLKYVSETGSRTRQPRQEREALRL
jgi:hypothetical protein